MKLGTVVCRAVFASYCGLAGVREVRCFPGKDHEKDLSFESTPIARLLYCAGKHGGIQKKARCGDCLICDGDRVWHRTAVTLSFARV